MVIGPMETTEASFSHSFWENPVDETRRGPSGRCIDRVDGQKR